MREGEKKRRVEDYTPELWNERKCAYCGKTFFSTQLWAYKRIGARRERWYCKYSCMAAHERENTVRRYTKIKN